MFKVRKCYRAKKKKRIEWVKELIKLALCMKKDSLTMISFLQIENL